ncbi:MAG: hypothetical protein WBF96_08355 [Phycisphaerae bacterium]
MARGDRWGDGISQNRLHAVGQDNGDDARADGQDHDADDRPDHARPAPARGLVGDRTSSEKFQVRFRPVPGRTRPRNAFDLAARLLKFLHGRRRISKVNEGAAQLFFGLPRGLEDPADLVINLFANFLADVGHPLATEDEDDETGGTGNGPQQS